MNVAEFIEHTNLKPILTGGDINRLVEETLRYNFRGICVPPFWVEKIRRDLNHHRSPSALVTVIGFPLGYNTTEAKLHETERALTQGADEIDVVWNISAFKSGMPWVKVELAKVARIVHAAEKLVKVIIETAYLTETECINACRICVDAGADFVKTSTGFAHEGATVAAVECIRRNVPPDVGVKASGGIKNLKTAEAMIMAGATRLGTSSGVQIMEEFQSINK